MKLITSTNARNNISALINEVKLRGEVFAIGRRESIDALIIPFPDTYNRQVNEITNINALSRSFDFLDDEPELYAVEDVKKKYE